MANYKNHISRTAISYSNSVLLRGQGGGFRGKDPLCTATGEPGTEEGRNRGAVQI